MEDPNKILIKAILIIAVIFLLLIAYAIWNYKKQRLIENEENEEIEESGKEYNPVYSTNVNHICGLPFAENSQCIIHLCDNQIVIEGTSQIVKLSKDKIIDMNIKTSKEVQNSISGAVGGAILLGPIGAFLYGSSTEFHRFFIIIYKKDNKDICISFDIKDNMKKYENINKYINEYKENVDSKEEIDF